MILSENIHILEKNYNDTYEYVKNIENEINKSLLDTEDTNTNLPNIIVNKDEKSLHLHSKYNPIREAKSIIDVYKERVKEDSIILFYGLGLGYHIDAFIEQYPNNDIYVYEPVEEIGIKYLSVIKIKFREQVKNIVIGEKNIDKLLNVLINRDRKDLIVIELPNHKKIFKNEFNNFLKCFKDKVERERINIFTDYTFQKKWIINGMKNFHYILNTPDILKHSKFKDKPVIIVSAGPSLDLDIEKIRYIKDNRLAYIVSAGSALDPLINNGIYPDLAFTLDPGEPNRRVFDNIVNLDIRQIPLVVASSAYYEIPRDYPGPMFHTITTQDSTSSYYLKEDEINLTSDASTVAAMTLNLIYKLGFDTVIFAGQNLGYMNNKSHANGRHIVNEVKETDSIVNLYTENVYDEKIMTTSVYESMKQNLELYIKEMSNVKIWNTTKHGAKIKGAEFIEIEELINKELIKEVVEKNISDINEFKYDKEYIFKKYTYMIKEHEKIKKIETEYKKILREIEKMLETKNYKKLDKLYIKLDNILKIFEENKYISTFILPMNRLSYIILIESIDKFNKEKNKRNKAEMIRESFEKFLNDCTRDISDLETIFQEMNESIREYCGLDYNNKLED